MTLLEAKKMPLPMPEAFKHKRLPYDTYYPANHNDVRYNLKIGNVGRRCFMHDTYMNSYDLQHDLEHSLGYRDEDMDFELPDPIEGMHFKRKRSPFWAYTMGLIWACLFFGYAIVGLKIPQKDNPFFWRKKYASPSSIEQMQFVSWLEYGSKNTLAFPHSHTLMTTDKGLEQVNSGIRFNIDSYKDFFC